MSSTVEGGRALARFRVLGFPVHLDVSFVVLLAILGYLSFSDRSGSDLLVAIVVWTVVAVVAVLVHELGHAVVARTTGARPQITLAGLGGLTTFVPPRPMSRGRSIAVSLAGPGVGILAGVAALALLPNVLDLGVPWQDVLYRSAVFTTLGWSVLNLLPVLPLDGGQALREVLPGEPAVRERRAAVVSVVAAVVVGLVAWRWGQAFLAVFMAFFAVSNLLTLRGPQTRLTPAQEVVGWLWRGEPERAREVLAAQPAGVVDDLAVHGAVLATNGQGEQGLALLAQEEARRPGDVDVAALVALTYLVRRDWAALLRQVEGERGALVPPALLEQATTVARAEGHADVAVRLAARTPGPGSPVRDDP